MQRILQDTCPWWRLAAAGEKENSNAVRRGGAGGM